jgi:hypothetical protein
MPASCYEDVFPIRKGRQWLRRCPGLCQEEIELLAPTLLTDEVNMPLIAKEAI